MKQCLCNPIQQPFEFKIKEDNYTELEEYSPDICGLKSEIIFEFQDVIHKLKCGIQPELEFLLEKISYIDIYDE